MRTYVREVVARYRESPAVWGWEFGNEYNLGADLPNAASHRPKVVPKLGTATTRTARDEMTHDIMVAALAAFAREVRIHDPYRFISSGNSRLRPSAWHQWKQKSWTQDDEAQYAERLMLDNPDPVNVLSLHVYEAVEKRFARTVGVSEFLRVTTEAARRAGKPVFVGEFGAQRVKPGESDEVLRERFGRILGAIEENRVPIAALWVFDFTGQRTTWNVTASNARAWQLDAIAEANRRIRARGP
jgi:hypothetical protein